MKQDSADWSWWWGEEEKGWKKGNYGKITREVGQRHGGVSKDMKTAG